MNGGSEANLQYKMFLLNDEIEYTQKWLNEIYNTKCFY